MSASVTPTPTNEAIIASIVSSFPKDAGKKIVETLIDGEDVEWAEAYQRPGGQVRTISGKYKSHSVDIKKVAKDQAKASVKKFLREANYTQILGNNVVGSTANWAADGAEFVDKWYGVLKAARTIATVSTGPLGLVFAAIAVYDGVTDARSALNSYIDQCGLEEHKRAGTLLKKLESHYQAVVKRIDQAVHSSFKLEDDLEDARTNTKKVNDFWKGRPPTDSAFVKSARSRTLEQANFRIEDTMELYAEHLRAFIGLLIQAEMLRAELDRIVVHCDEDPLMYWGCSFTHGYKNPNIGTLSFDSNLRPKVVDYTVTQWNDGTFGASKHDIQNVLNTIKKEVRGHAIKAANEIDSNHLRRLRGRAPQIADTLARWKKSH
jgi:hypothetical protein